LHLIDEIRAHGIDDPYWTFGGGTVLMLRYRHRRSKDIDIFVPDPQYLGYVSPRLSEVAEAISADYVEGAGFVKLIRPEGEIDFVASPNLTAHPVRDLVTAASIGSRRDSCGDRCQEALAPWRPGERTRSV
jgi:hypothetical protein